MPPQEAPEEHVVRVDHSRAPLAAFSLDQATRSTATTIEDSHYTEMIG